MFDTRGDRGESMHCYTVRSVAEGWTFTGLHVFFAFIPVRSIVSLLSAASEVERLNECHRYITRVPTLDLMLCRYNIDLSFCARRNYLSCFMFSCFTPPLSSPAAMRQLTQAVQCSVYQARTDVTVIASSPISTRYLLTINVTTYQIRRCDYCIILVRV